MNEEAAFLAAIAADPKDELGYLVFADWLQEQGEEVRAGLVRDPRTRQLLGPTLADPFPELRTHLLAKTEVQATRERFRAFGEAGVPTLIRVLAEAEDPAVIANAVECAKGLGRSGRELLPSIVPLVRHANPSVAYRASFAVGKIGFGSWVDEGSFEKLEMALRTESSSLQDAAVRALKPDRIRKKILPGLDRDRHSPDPEVRLGVLRALVACKLPETKLRLPSFLQDASPRIRLEAIEVLNYSDSPEVADRIVGALSDTEAEIRHAACRRCFWYRDRLSDSTMQRVRAALREPDETVAVELADRLGRNGAESSSALPELLAWLPRVEPETWRKLMNALLRIAPQHPDVRAALIRRLDDPDPVRAVDVVEPVRTCGGAGVEMVDGLIRLVGHGSITYRGSHTGLLQVLASVRPVLPKVLGLFDDLLRNSGAGMPAFVDPAERITGYGLPPDGPRLSEFADPVERLGEFALPLLPAIEARFLAGDYVGRMGFVLGSLGQPGLELLLRMLTATRQNSERVEAILAGFGVAAKSSPDLLPTLREMLSEFDESTQLKWRLCNAILGMGPAASGALGDVMTHFPADGNDCIVRAVADGFSDAFESWLEGMAGRYRAPHRIGMYRGILEVLLLLKPRAGHVRHLREILEAVGEIHRLQIPVPVDLSGTNRLVRLVCESAIRLGFRAEPMAPELADILAGRYCTPTLPLNRMVVRALGTVANPTVAPILIPLLRHEDEVIAARAAISLGKIGSDDAVPALTFALGDPRARVRREAARALNRIGSADDTVLERLHGLAEDEDPKVRRDAKRAHKVLAAKAAREHSGSPKDE